MTLAEAVNKTKAYLCLECGICTGSCPVSRVHAAFSPRLMVERALLLPSEEVLDDPEVWSCLTCGSCSVRCPSTVDYSEFTRQTRMGARDRGNLGRCTHAGTLSALMELGTKEFYRRQIDWLPPGVRISERGEVLYFMGCLPFFDIVFEHLDFPGKEIAAGAVRVLNALGVEPVVSDRERCCGHDFYWTGRLEEFKALGRANVQMIRDLGVKQVVFTCPEGYAMFRQVYPLFFGDLDVELVHLTELVARGLDQGVLQLGRFDHRMTYQDPCRLGRMLEIYDPPRKVLASLEGGELVEMGRTRADALCCGSSSWVNCTEVNKLVQVERLVEAAETDAEYLVTACPKCAIHLRCALKDLDSPPGIQIIDLTSLVAATLPEGE